MKKLNLNLFETGFIFPFKWNKHIVLTAKREWVIVANLEYDEDFSFIEEMIILTHDELINSIDNSIYFINYEDIEEEALWWEYFNLLT